jgi:hypothetical protein
LMYRFMPASPGWESGALLYVNVLKFSHLATRD